MKGEFARRPQGQGIFRLETYEPGKLSADFPVAESANVVLHYEDGTIVVNNISRREDGMFSGSILGFEPPMEEFQGLRVGEEVSFSEDNVFSASKKD